MLRRVTRRDEARRIVILGGSVAGAFAAAALAGHGRTVTVLERDALPDEPAPRRGVPQGRQPHVFLHRGLMAVEELLPGVEADLRAAGGVPLDTGDMAWLGEFGWAPMAPQYGIVSATRPLFEHVVLRHVRALRRRRGVRPDGGRGPATRSADGRWSVRVEGGGLDPGGPRRRRLGALVATARLARAAGPAARADVAGRRAGRVRDRRGAQCSRGGRPCRASRSCRHRRAPAGSRCPSRASRWLVAAVGSGDRRPGRDRQSFVDALAGLPDGALADLVADADAERDRGPPAGQQRAAPLRADGASGRTGCSSSATPCARSTRSTARASRSPRSRRWCSATRDRCCAAMPAR